MSMFDYYCLWRFRAGSRISSCVSCLTGIFNVYRLLTGSILAHEMMHAWLRLKGEFYFVLIIFHLSSTENFIWQ